jgi:xyloglucan-specific exo-beta-1,4-glucanase
MSKSLQFLTKLFLFFGVLSNLIAQTYTWDNVQIGGGGFVTGIVYSKTEANLKYARTDVGGAYRWDNANSKWIPLLDWVNEDQVGYTGVEAMAIDPKNNDIVYFLVGTDYWNSGKTAILKSTNRGNSFTETIVTSQFKAHGNGMGRSNGERLAIDPNNSNILFCGTRRNGLFKSTNGGTTWTNVGSFPVSTTSNDNCICFVIFDGSSVTGGVTQTIYAGVSRTGSSNLYKSTDAGATWVAVSGATTTYMPQRAVLASDKTLYITYASHEGPWNITAGGQISKLNTTSGTWTNITPSAFTSNVGFGGISVDPSNSQRIIASSMNLYWTQYNYNGSGVYGDRLFLSTNGGTSWTDLVGSSFITLNANGCTWFPGQSIHWTGDIQFDPFNTARASVISGNGIFTCDNVNTYPTTWKFDAKGLEEVVPLDIVSVPSGPLMTVIGDYDGFKHTDVSVYAPQHSPTTGTSTGITYASGNTQKLVRVGNDMFYTTNQGTSWTKTASISGQKGRVALSFDGNTILHCPEGSSTTYRSTNNGSSWSTCNGISIKDAFPVSDPVTNNKFYAYNTTSGAVLVSTDGGANFTTAGTTSTGGSQIIRTAPGLAGHLWIALKWGGLRRSTDGGKTFTTPSSAVTVCDAVGLGAKAIGANYFTIYIWGTINGVKGLYRSTDEGATWTRVNDDAHEYGGPGNGQFVIGDMNTFGVVYMSTVGRGLVYGKPGTVTDVTDVTESAEISTYPNPFTNEITLQYKGEFEYAIYDVNGANKGAGFAQDQATLGKELAKGLYIVHIKQNDKLDQVKIVKK